MKKYPKSKQVFLNIIKSDFIKVILFLEYFVKDELICSELIGHIGSEMNFQILISDIEKYDFVPKYLTIIDSKIDYSTQDLNFNSFQSNTLLKRLSCYNLPNLTDSLKKYLLLSYSGFSYVSNEKKANIFNCLYRMSNDEKITLVQKT